ncbi:hypothetical protein OSSY52_02240 [Tepiditoga spiralis]|uniref:ABC transporter domain-containing protein n=1 Tax=Tepiditoga spiralis TaxID=2108365 RepID=A0A7G1G5M5_9BACT|nr:ABC transporter ATP-binding protein [Tepiditoga spiralis]BBE30083.1 hypothetical protein OSSY52_02240 [Tepiditoga spiralis]
MIKFEKVSFNYKNKVEVLNDLTVEFPSNEITGLIGHNGAGKTTIYRLISNLILPSEGKIIINQDMITDYKKQVAYIPSGASIYERLTAYENLVFRAKIIGLSKDEYDKKIKILLKKLKLSKRIHDKAYDFSNGMKKRLGLASALIGSPKLLLIDEALNGIDPESINIIVNILKELNENGTTIIITSHDLSLIHDLCTEIKILNEGEFVYQGEKNKEFKDFKEFYLSLTTNYDEEEDFVE